MSAEDTIKETVTNHDVVLFMKGTKMMPQCGFSSRVAGVLNYMGVEFQDVNVLADDAIRQGIKDYSDWPTIPQLYVKGEFVGGCDIVTEMTLSGELDTLFEENGVSLFQGSGRQDPRSQRLRPRISPRFARRPARGTRPRSPRQPSST
jgi:monothiol glutaredoxin